MKMPRAIILLALLTGLAVSPSIGTAVRASGQFQGSPPSGIIGGRVVDTGGRPIGGARVRLNDEGADVSTAPSVQSDAQGAFVFRNVAGGRFQITFAKDGYAPNADAGRWEVPVSLRDGERRSGV